VEDGELGLLLLGPTWTSGELYMHKEKSFGRYVGYPTPTTRPGISNM
jgi:hypothetical protein